MWFSGTAKGIHHYGYGTLTDNSIEVYRRNHDVDVEQIRVVISQPNPPDYDSLAALGDWQDIDPGSVFTFTPNLNWNPGLLTVRAECYDTASG